MIEMCCGRNLSVLKSQPSKLLGPQRHTALPVSPLTVTLWRRVIQICVRRVGSKCLRLLFQSNCFLSALVIQTLIVTPMASNCSQLLRIIMSLHNIIGLPLFLPQFALYASEIVPLCIQMPHMFQE